MKKLNSALNNFKFFGLNIGHVAVIIGLIWSVMQITSSLRAEQREEVKIHNDSATAHPNMTLAIKALEQQIDSNFQVMLEEIRRINAR